MIWQTTAHTPFNRMGPNQRKRVWNIKISNAQANACLCI